MTCIKKMAAFSLSLFFAGVASTSFAQVQNNQPAQPPTTSQRPAMNQTPAQTPQPAMNQHQSPEMDQNQNQQPALNLNQDQAKTTVSDKELKEFASVYPKVRDESQKAQQKMAAVIEKDGMKLQRFNELETARLHNQKTDASKEEMETFKKITKELDAIQPQVQKNIESVITSSGLSVQRFQAIAMAIQNNKDLQNKVQKLINGGNSDS